MGVGAGGSGGIGVLLGLQQGVGELRAVPCTARGKAYQQGEDDYGKPDEGHV